MGFAVGRMEGGTAMPHRARPAKLSIQAGSRPEVWGGVWAGSLPHLNNNALS